jgi:hypothetical protein
VHVDRKEDADNIEVLARAVRNFPNFELLISTQFPKLTFVSAVHCFASPRTQVHYGPDAKP